MVTLSTRKRIACLHKEVFYPVQILKALRSENLQGSLASVTRIINKIQKTGSTENRPRSGRPTKLPADAKALIKKQMRTKDEATSIQIQKQLAKRAIVVNSSTVQRSRAKQGKTLQRTHYCQLIRVANKVKRLEYAQQILDSGDKFHNSIMFYSPMNAQSPWNNIDVHVTERSTSHWKEHRNLNIHLNYTYGQKSAERELLTAYSMVKWI